MFETHAGGPPTQGEVFAKLMEHLREAQECMAMLGHLYKANDDNLRGSGFLAASELLRKMQHQVMRLAQGRLQ